MSQINTRNRQLGLAFDDADLRKLGHDDIMLWLTDWVKDASNLHRLLKPAYRQIGTSVEQRLTPDADRFMKTLPYVEQQGITDAMKNYPLRAALAGLAAPDVSVWGEDPAIQISLSKNPVWELPLKDDRKIIIGYCDLYCELEISDILVRQITRYFRITRQDPQPPFYRQWTAEFDHEDYSQSQQSRRHVVFFEVKSEIKSVGELLRQLQLYRSSVPLRNTLPEQYGSLVVVAPPHNSAASICRENGFDFLEFRPHDAG